MDEPLNDDELEPRLPDELPEDDIEVDGPEIPVSKLKADDIDEPLDEEEEDEDDLEEFLPDDIDTE